MPGVSVVQVMRLKVLSLLLLLALQASVHAEILPASAESPQHHIPLKRHSASTYYMQGSIGNLSEAELLIDTGSSYTAINETMLTGLLEQGQARYLRDLRGTMANGSIQTVPLYRITSIRLGETCWVANVDAAVMPGNTRPILGMSLLARVSPFLFSTQPPTLRLSNCLAQRPAETAALQP